MTALREGRTGEAAGDYRRHGRVHLSQEPSIFLEQMVESWWTARCAGDDAVLYAYAREAARVLNRMARARAEADNKLSGLELNVAEWTQGDLSGRAYRVGDELCCLRNHNRLGAKRDASGRGVRNGTRGTIVTIDHEAGELTLATTDGRRLVLPEEYVRRFTDYGYAWTLHKGQGQTVGQTDRGTEADELRRRGRAFVFGAESLTAEAALVAASRATDSTELFVLIDPDEHPETPTAVAESLGRSWARSEHQHLASEELDAASEIARLARVPRVDLGEERDALVALIGPGPAADLRWREDDSLNRLGAALVHRDEVIEEERGHEREVADPETFDAASAREQLRATRRARAVTEHEAQDAHADAVAVEHAIVAQARIRRERGSDVRTALDRLEIVDSALSTRRQQELAALAPSPPRYAVGLLGPEPADRGRALRWRQGLIEIEDWRRSVDLPPNSDGASPWESALGPAPDGWDGRRRRKTVASLRAVRRDLGLEQPVAAAGSGSPDPQRDVAAKILARSGRRIAIGARTNRAGSPPSREA